MKESTTEVLIVGAGPTGLVLACDLRRRQVPTLLIDRAEAPSTESRALALQAMSLEALDNLGVVEAFLEKGVIVTGVRSYNRGRLHHSFRLETTPRLDAPYPYLLIVEQHVTESILLAQLGRFGGGASVQRGVELKRLQDDSDQVRCWLRTPTGEQQIRSSYLVGCDGAYSTVRQLKGIEARSEASDITYHVADVELDWGLPPDEIVWLVHGATEIVATPLYGERRYRLNLWSAGPSAEEETGFGALQAPMELAQWQLILERLAPCDVTIANPRSLMAYRTGHGLADSMHRGRTLLAGDAAHQIPHCMAQGLNLGLQDAYNLGWKLELVVKGHAPPELLETYGSERRAVARQALWAVGSEPSLMGRASHLESREALDEWSQLSLNYRPGQDPSGSLAASTVSAGDRAPDGELGREGEGVLYLHDLLDGLSHHLLVFTDLEDPRLEGWIRDLKAIDYPALEVHRLGGAAEAYRDPENLLHRAYSAEHGDLVLIRPDRFVAARGKVSEDENLLRYLAERLCPQAG